MLTLSILWILVVSNLNVYHLYWGILMLLIGVNQNIISMHVLDNTKLLFNSYTSYDNLTHSIIIIGSLIAIWLITLIVYPMKHYTKNLFLIQTINMSLPLFSSTMFRKYGNQPKSGFIKEIGLEKKKEKIYNKNDLTINKITSINNTPTEGTEYTAFIFLLLIAMGSLAGTNSYLTLLVAIELQSLVLYILLATNLVSPAERPRGNLSLFLTTSVLKKEKTELNFKMLPNKLSKISLSYLINAAAATALLIFGFSIKGNLLVLIAILWKLGVMPVHAWSLPILDNQNSLTVSIYLTITKYGTLLIIGLIASQSTVTIQILTYIGLLNLTVGNILGLLQFRYQRIIVYSSLIQIGYMLLILGNSSSLGLGYFELYSFFTIILLILWIVPTFTNLNANNLLPSVQVWTLILTLYTVAGLPFFPLFWTKLDVLLIIQSESLMIALFSTLLSSLIYIRLIKYISHLRNI